MKSYTWSTIFLKDKLQGKLGHEAKWITNTIMKQHKRTRVGSIKKQELTSMRKVYNMTQENSTRKRKCRGLSSI